MIKNNLIEMNFYLNLASSFLSEKFIPLLKTDTIGFIDL